MVATAASVVWERRREETRQLMFSFESKVRLRVNIYAYYDGPAQGTGALNTSLSLEAEQGRN